MIMYQQMHLHLQLTILSYCNNIGEAPIMQGMLCKRNIQEQCFSLQVFTVHQ